MRRRSGSERNEVERLLGLRRNKVMMKMMKSMRFGGWCIYVRSLWHIE